MILLKVSKQCLIFFFSGEEQRMFYRWGRLTSCHYGIRTDIGIQNFCQQSTTHCCQSFFTAYQSIKSEDRKIASPSAVCSFLLYRRRSYDILSESAVASFDVTTLQKKSVEEKKPKKKLKNKNKDLKKGHTNSFSIQFFYF